MTTDTAPPQLAYDEWRTRRWRLTGLAFALLWLVTAVSVGLVGEKQSGLGNLQSGIASGSVTHVEIVGFRDDAGWRGRTTVTLKWQGTVLSRYADVVVDTRRNPGDHHEADVIVGDPADYLRTSASDLHVSYSDRTGFQEWRGWRGPGWAATLGLVAWFGTFLLAGSGPEPWRATRWAWMWLTLLGGPLGCAAFLLLGGPLGLRRPADTRRRLTGGWAFLLAVLLLGGADAT